MPHVRTDLRNGFSTLLGQIDSIEGLKHFANRVHPLAQGDYPCTIIKSGPERIEPGTKNRIQNSPQKRYITTEVYGFVRANESLEDVADNLILAIEKVVFSDPTIGGIADSTSLTEIIPHFTGSPNAPTEAVLMRFVSIVWTMEGTPEKSFSN